MADQQSRNDSSSVQGNGAFLPPDILLLIFDNLVSDTLHLPWPQAKYDKERARAPFVLASVCSHWRELTLSTASLWSYLGFRDGHEPFEELELRAARSVNSAVDVYFQPNSCDPDSDGARCLALLHALAPRWRNVYINYPRVRTSRRAKIELAWLTSCTTPHMRSLYLGSAAMGEHDSQALMEVLPHAPRLLRVFLDDLAINWAFHKSFTCMLTDLSLWLYSWSTRALCAFLTQFAWTLTTLTLIGKTGGPHEDVMVGVVVILPNLLQLTLHNPEWLAHIHTPNLCQLELAASSMEHDVVSHLEPLTGVKTVVLWGDVTVTDIRYLQTLCNVTDLKIAVPSGYYEIFGRDSSGDLCNVPAAVLRCLIGTASELEIWPQLQKISFGSDADPLPQRMLVDLEALVDLVHRRRDLHDGTARLQLHVAPAVTSQELLDVAERLTYAEIGS